MSAKQMLWVVAVLAVGMVCWAGAAQAALVNVDINKALTYSGSTATSWSPTFTGAAVVNPGVTSQTWNALNQPNTSNPSTGSVPVLVDSEGNASSVTLPAFSLPNGDFRDNTGDAAPDLGYRDLMGDRPQAGSDPASVTIRGLDAGAWDLYIFGFGDGNGSSGWNVKDGTAAIQSSGWTTFGPDLPNPSSLVEGTHYLHFSGTHVAGTDILVSNQQISGEGTNYGQVRWAGFQVTPEPATMALLGLGGLGVLFGRKRR